MTRFRFRSSLVLGSLLVFLSACTDDHDHNGDGDHGGEHAHGPTHGGQHVEFGEDFAFLELKLNEDTGELQAWAKGAHANPGLRLKQTAIEIAVKDAEPFTVTLQAQADPLSGETPGDSSKFRGQSERLRGMDAFDATIVEIELRGMAFKEHEFSYGGDDHDHDHEGE